MTSSLERVAGVAQEDVLEARPPQVDLDDPGAARALEQPASRREPSATVTRSTRPDGLRSPALAARNLRRVATTRETPGCASSAAIAACGRSSTSVTTSPPSSALSASGLPDAAIRPASTIAIASHSASASSIECVVRNSVVSPLWRSARSSSQITARAATSRPVVGSSRNEHAGAVQQTARDLDAAAQATRELAHGLVRVLGEAEPLDPVARARGGRVEVEQARVQRELLARGQLRIERRLLEHDADLPAHRGALAHDVAAEQRDLARARREQRREHAHRRRLARAVRAEQAEADPARHVEVDARERRGLAVALLEAAHTDRGVCGGGGMA
jgi:hypothetical protein